MATTKDIKVRAPRNRTLSLTRAEEKLYEHRLLRLNGSVSTENIENRIINEDLFQVLDLLPAECVDLLFLDPPYNLTKTYNASVFRERTSELYSEWFEAWFAPLLRVLKPGASVYVCCDWRCSGPIHSILEKYLTVRNRITWEREKGRGAAMNWKNCSEDIWFATLGNDYTFNLDDVKLKRKVIAPYRNGNGNPRDWQSTSEGNFRLTHPSNVWTDLTVPFWSMPENTDHPTQKPEKLLAKIILAGSNENDLVLDPFNGSGTSSVVAKKLNRKYVGIELDRYYCLLAEKRLEIAAHEPSIQGYAQGVFWERNSK